MRFVLDKKSGQMVPENMLSKLYPPEATPLEKKVFAWLDNNVKLATDNSYSTRVLAREFFLQYPEFDVSENTDAARNACAKWFNANQDKVNAEERRRSSTESKKDRLISPMKTINLAKVGADGIATIAAEGVDKSDWMNDSIKDQMIAYAKEGNYTGSDYKFIQKFSMEYSYVPEAIEDIWYDLGHEVRKSLVASESVSAKAAVERAKAKPKKYWLTYGDWEGSRCLLKFDRPVDQEQAKEKARELGVLQENIYGYSSLADAEKDEREMAKRNAVDYNDGEEEQTKIVDVVVVHKAIEDKGDLLKHIPEEHKNGDCYQQAWKTFYANIDKNPLLVHGIVEGRGPLSGIKYNHAWVEIGDMVYDKTMPIAANGIDKRIYYGIGNIDDKYCGTAGLVFRYNDSQVTEKAAKEKTYGPWEIKLWEFP